MFMIDKENEEYEDNPGFVLEGATQLAVSGAVLLASAFLMWEPRASQGDEEAKAYPGDDVWVFRFSYAFS